MGKNFPQVFYKQRGLIGLEIWTGRQYPLTNQDKNERKWYLKQLITRYSKDIIRLYKSMMWAINQHSSERNSYY